MTYAFNSSTPRDRGRWISMNNALYLRIFMWISFSISLELDLIEVVVLGSVICNFESCQFQMRHYFAAYRLPKFHNYLFLKLLVGENKK